MNVGDRVIITFRECGGRSAFEIAGTVERVTRTIVYVRLDSGIIAEVPRADVRPA